MLLISLIEEELYIYFIQTDTTLQNPIIYIDNTPALWDSLRSNLEHPQPKTMYGNLNFTYFSKNAII